MLSTFKCITFFIIITGKVSFCLRQRIGRKRLEICRIGWTRGKESLRICRYIIGPILDDRLKKVFLKPWKIVSICLSVYLSVCMWGTEHTFWPRNFFGLSDLWDTRKIHIFYFKMFIFTLFTDIIRFVSLYNASQFLFSSYMLHFFTYSCDI